MQTRLSVTLVWVAIAVPVLSCGDEGRERSEDRAAADRRPTPAGVLPCTDKDEPTNFDAYSLGREFEGLPLTGVDRMCTEAPSFAPPYVRENVVAYYYGDCDIPPDQEEGGCRLPLTIQSRPRCERDPSDYYSSKVTVRGVPGRLQDGGVELLTGDAVVNVSAIEPGRALRAARALIKAPAKPSDPVDEAEASDTLPPAKPRPKGCANPAEAPRPKLRRPAPSHKPPKLPTAPSEPPGKAETAFPPAPLHREPSSPPFRTPEEARAHMEQAERVRRLPRSREAGCERAVFPLGTPRVIWGPPRPRLVAARRLGKHVTVNFEFNRLPRSPACRPFLLRVTILSGKLDTPSFRISEGEFRVVRVRSSGSVRVPAGGRPPYRARIQALTVDYKPSEPVEARVR